MLRAALVGSLGNYLRLRAVGARARRFVRADYRLPAAAGPNVEDYSRLT